MRRVRRRRLRVPGVPGIPHFAHAGDVAWAITNAMADYQDVYAEQLRLVDGRVEARGPDGWQPASRRVESIPVRGHDPQQVEIVTTERGAVFSGSVAEGTGLSLRAASAVLGDLGFDAILPLLRARCVDDVDRALEGWVEPVNNVVIADRNGAVRYRVAGGVPVRDEPNRRGIVSADDPHTAWTGWLDPLPRTTSLRTAAGDRERAARTGEHRDRDHVRAAAPCPPPPRPDGRSRGPGPGRLRAFHDDTLLPVFDRSSHCSIGPNPAWRDGRARAIRRWDGRMEAGSPGAAAYAAWRSASVGRPGSRCSGRWATRSPTTRC